MVDETCSFYREFDIGLLVWDSSPSSVMLVVNEENGVCGMKCVELLPRTKQHVIFCLYRTFREPFVEFTKYNLIVRGYGRLHHGRPWPSSFWQIPLFLMKGLVHAFCRSIMVFFGCDQVMDNN